VIYEGIPPQRRESEANEEPLRTLDFEYERKRVVTAQDTFVPAQVGGRQRAPVGLTDASGT
jgi:hypothetical protein